MTTFDDRENSFEKAFAHDESLRFRAEARRNKLLGLWAAGLMGKDGEAAQAYAKEVIKADLEEAGDEDVFRKVRGDFDAAGVDQSDHQIRRQMEECMAEANGVSALLLSSMKLTLYLKGYIFSKYLNLWTKSRISARIQAMHIIYRR